MYRDELLEFVKQPMGTKLRVVIQYETLTVFFTNLRIKGIYYHCSRFVNEVQQSKSKVPLKYSIHPNEGKFL